MRKIWCCLWVLILININAASASPALILSDDSASTGLLPYAEHFEDPTGQLDLTDLLTGDKEFTGQSEPLVNLGLSRSHHWFRFSVINQSQYKDWYLELTGSLSRKVNVFVEEEGTYQALKKMPWSTSNRYQLSFLPSKQTTIYMQLYDSQGFMIVSPQLSSAAATIHSISYKHAFFAFLMSGLLVLAAYNLLYYFHLRDTAFLTLSLFITFVALTMGNNEGLLNFFPWMVKYVAWLAPAFLFVMVISALRLGMNLLDIRQRLPELTFWYDVGSVLSVILMIVALIYGYSLPLGGLMGAYGILLIFITFGKLIYRQYTIPKSLLVSILIFIIASLPIVLTVMDVIEYYPPITNWFFVATLVSFLIMSLTQAEKIRLKSEYIERTTATNQAKDEFLTTMSHELRTPMNAVVGAGRLLKLTPLSKEQTEYVSRLNHSSAHMLSLVNDLLDLARVDHQLLQLEKIPFKLEETLHTLEQLLKESASKKRLQLTLENHFLSLNKQLIGDPTRLNQVLLNLLSNAIKFTHHGKVSLTITLIEIHHSQASLRFEVTDTGIGLTEAQQLELFQPFTQAESSTNRQYGGSGLGLAISQKLVKRMGGELQVSSTYKQGSCFSFTLNFALEANDSKPEAELSTPPKSLNGFKVLLVDDDEMNRFFGQKLLEVCDMEVVVAESGEMAIEKMQQQAFDLVFMDISMPNIDGYEATRRLRLLPDINEVIVVALTAHAIAGERERCIEAGMDDYLTKPFELDDLRNMMAKWLVNKPIRNTKYKN